MREREWKGSNEPAHMLELGEIRDNRERARGTICKRKRKKGMRAARARGERRNGFILTKRGLRELRETAKGHG